MEEITGTKEELLAIATRKWTNARGYSVEWRGDQLVFTHTKGTPVPGKWVIR